MWKEKEFLKQLEFNGIDTCCFMGSGFYFTDYKVGQEFYYTYAYYGTNAKKDKPETFKDVKTMLLHQGVNITDRFKLLSKYKYAENPIRGRFRKEYITIRNLRTGVVRQIRFDEEIELFYYCLMAEPVS